jgi:hypothetical protein
MAAGRSAPPNAPRRLHSVAGSAPCGGAAGAADVARAASAASSSGSSARRAGRARAAGAPRAARAPRAAPPAAMCARRLPLRRLRLIILRAPLAPGHGAGAAGGIWGRDAKGKVEIAGLGAGWGVGKGAGGGRMRWAHVRAGWGPAARLDWRCAAAGAPLRARAASGAVLCAACGRWACVCAAASLHGGMADWRLASQPADLEARPCRRDQAAATDWVQVSRPPRSRARRQRPGRRSEPGAQLAARRPRAAGCRGARRRGGRASAAPRRTWRRSGRRAPRRPGQDPALHLGHSRFPPPSRAHTRSSNATHAARAPNPSPASPCS